MGKPVPILMYHQVSKQPHRSFDLYTVTPTDFERQIASLAAGGYEAITLDHLADAREGKRELPARPIIITFDDGFTEAAENAVPVLGQYGFTAVFFLVAGLVGTSSRWLIPEGMEFPLFGWDTARWLCEQGFQCESHTMTHPGLKGMEPSAIEFELSESRRILEQELGKPVTHLAYPYGLRDESVRRIAAKVGYRTACSVVPGLARRGSPLLDLRRIWVPIEEFETERGFMFRVRTSFRPIEWAVKWVTTLRPPSR